MKKRHALSLIMVIVMLVSLITVMPTAVSAEAAAEVSAEPKILSFANESDIVFDGTGSLYYTKTSYTDLYASTVASNSYNDDEKALELSYASEELVFTRNGTNYATGRYRFLPCFTTKDVLGTDYKYVSILYKTTTDEAHTLWIQKRSNANLKKAGTEVSGKANVWTYTEPLDVSSVGVFFSGLNARQDVLFSFNTADTNAEFYIKELAFFKTAEDAAVWYADINGYLGIEEEPVYNDPIVMSFEDAQATDENAKLFYYAADPTLTGTWEYDANEKALAVTYTEEETNMTIGRFSVGKYRFGPSFKEANVLGSTYKYACVVYKTDASAWNLYVHNPGATNLRITATTQNVQANKWLITDPIDFSTYSAYLTRLNNPSHLLFGFDCADTDATFYVKKIMFFDSAEAAAAWTVKADAELNPAVIMSYRSAEDTAKNAKLYYHAADPTLTGTWDYDANTKSLAVTYTEEETDMTIGKFSVGKYRFTPAFTSENVLGEDYKYARVVYMTDSDADYKLYIHNPGASNLRMEGFTQNKAANKWVVTDIIDLSTYAAYMTRLNSAAHLVLGFATADTDATFYIKEIGFFRSEEAAESWYEDLESYIKADGTVIPEPTPEVAYGDADGTGVTDGADLISFGRMLAKWSGYVLPEDSSILDLNSDGKVNPLDMVYLARHLAGWDDYKVLPIVK